MMIWHERRGAGLLLRLGGLVLLGVAWLLGLWMVSLVRSHSPDEGTPLELVVGMTMFASVSLGTSALVLGRHLFDQVEISERWARRTIDPSVVDLKFASLNVMARSEFQILKPHENQIVASDPVESEVRSVLSP